MNKRQAKKEKKKMYSEIISAKNYIGAYTEVPGRANLLHMFVDQSTNRRKLTHDQRVLYHVLCCGTFRRFPGDNWQFDMPSTKRCIESSISKKGTRMYYRYPVETLCKDYMSEFERNYEFGHKYVKVS